MNEGSAKLAWVLLRDYLAAREGGSSEKLQRLLLSLPAIFDDGDRQAVRQNVRGTQIQPLHTMQRAALCLQAVSSSLATPEALSNLLQSSQGALVSPTSGRKATGKKLCQAFDQMVVSYQTLLDLEGAGVKAQPAA